jgi:hypothetical protein
MTAQLWALTFDSLDARALATFWAGMLGREVEADGASYELPSPEPGQPRLRFVPTGAVKAGPNRIHLHLTSTSETDFRATVERALTLGGSHLDVGQLPEEDHVVLADPEGNELCVIPPDNKFLAGTGQLGELACDGSRAVGVFWSEALGWPLVWDQDEETAIQSPDGGTKIAWGGPPRAPKYGERDRLRLEVAADDDEVERLVGLGASRVGAGQLADPDGNDVDVRPAAAVRRP